MGKALKEASDSQGCAMRRTSSRSASGKFQSRSRHFPFHVQPFHPIQVDIRQRYNNLAPIRQNPRGKVDDETKTLPDGVYSSRISCNCSRKDTLIRRSTIPESPPILPLKVFSGACAGAGCRPRGSLFVWEPAFCLFGSPGRIAPDLLPRLAYGRFHRSAEDRCLFGF